MQFVRYLDEEGPRLGFLMGEWVVDYRAGTQVGAQLTDLAPLLLGSEAARAEARRAWDQAAASPDPGARRPAAETHFLAPLALPGKILCVGQNYPAYGAGDQPPPDYPIFFLKTASALTGHRQPIRYPRISRRVEAEGELALVIGAVGRSVSPADAFNLIAGYTIANDVGALDIQQRTSQWSAGKIFDTFCPLGPALVTSDEILNPGDLALTTRINGRVVQAANTGEMHFDVAALVSYLSTLVTLEPGDLILTGSPRRAGDQPAGPLTLRPGDVVDVSIAGLGTLTNPVEEA